MKHFDYLRLFFKGVVVGMIDIVPGISGGTVVLIMGIYEELLQAIQAFDMAALRLLITGQFKNLWKHLQGPFLLPLALGMGLSMMTTVQLITYLLNNHPIQTWSFFLGLILVAIFTVYKKIKQWHVRTVLISLGGVVVAYGITQATPLHIPYTTSWFIGLSGCIAVCAMLLPGISGSYMLVLLGKYVFMLHALQTFQLNILIPFALGGVVGLLSFSRLVAWLLHRYHDNTLALLAGFMLGSLSKVWPFQQLLNTSAYNSWIISSAQSPATYHQECVIFQTLFWTSLGVLTVVGLGRLAHQKKISE